MHISYWEYNTFLKDIDFTIIGSGIVGLSTAIEVRKKHPKAKIVVLEKGFLPSGASTKNAGFACFGSPTEILDDFSKMSKEEVFKTVEKRWLGLQNLKQLLGEKNIGFEAFGSCELFTKNDTISFQKVEDNLESLNKFLLPIFKEHVFKKKDSLISEYGFNNISHIIQNKFEGQINTGLTMKNLIKLALEKDILILNGINVKAIDNDIVITENFDLKSNKIIVATNGFAKTLLPEYDVEPARAQVLITKPIENLKLKGTFHYEQGYYYFRNVGNRVLFGGGRNLAFEEENTTKIELTELIQNKLDELLKNVIIPYEKNIEVDMRWAGIMGVGSKKTTIVKQINEHLFCAVRMGGMGVAIGSLIGKEVAELV